ncbi:MAG: alpha/beta fold hydrolase [Maricaulaceae bacterium]
MTQADDPVLEPEGPTASANAQPTFDNPKGRPERTYPLAAFGGDKPPAPDWFTAALERLGASETGRVAVDGAEIAWRAVGPRGAQPVVLIHGGVAHQGWWDPIVGFLAQDGLRVVTLDLSGMGDSGWREQYLMNVYAEEVRAVAQAAGAFDAETAPILVGHSFGGFVAFAAARAFGDRLSGVVVLDSPVRPFDPDRRPSPPRRGGRSYANPVEALSRFRLLPDQPCENLFLVDHIARASLRADPSAGPDGVTWKFDPELWIKMAFDPIRPDALAASLQCPLALMRGARSDLVTDAVWSFMGETFRADTPQVSIPDARHHVLLDQPLALTSALRALLSGWPKR